MLAMQKIITDDDCDKILAGLQSILDDLDSGALKFDMDAEDIHMFVESELTKRIGDVGKKLHTARSRNDQVAVDIRLYLRDETEEIIPLIKNLLAAILSVAKDNKNTILPGYTHLQRAQPITFAHHLLAYAMMFIRDIGRLEDAMKRMNYSPLGSCALSGTTYNTNREFVAEQLGFDGITLNSIDGVSDRDFCVELMSAFATIMMHLSRFRRRLYSGRAGSLSSLSLTTASRRAQASCLRRRTPIWQSLSGARRVVFTATFSQCSPFSRVFRLHTTRICRRTRSAYLTALLQLSSVLKFLLR